MVDASLRHLPFEERTVIMMMVVARFSSFWGKSLQEKLIVSRRKTFSVTSCYSSGVVLRCFEGKLFKTVLHSQGKVTSCAAFLFSENGENL